jgi:hypothetical protein
MKPKAIAMTRTISTIGRRTNAANLRNGTKPQSHAQTTINVATTTARQISNSDVNADIISFLLPFASVFTESVSIRSFVQTVHIVANQSPSRNSQRNRRWRMENEILVTFFMPN